MSRQADILFCKIAITAGMVSQQQAQKVLAFVEKKEQETGRRPILAAVFTKHQLMTTEQVQKVKAAVAKRTGEPIPVHRPAPSARAGGKRGRGRKREKSAKRPVDQQTLLMGAGFGVVFVGVLITICYLYLVSGGSGGSEASSGESGQTVTPGGSVDSRPGTSAPEIELPPVPEDKELPRDVVLDISQRLSDILLDRIDNPARARASFGALRGFIEERQGQGYLIPEDISTRMREMEEGLADIGAEDSTPAEEPPVLEPPGEEAKEPPAEETKTEAGDLDLDDLDDLDDF